MKFNTRSFFLLCGDLFSFYLALIIGLYVSPIEMTEQLWKLHFIYFSFLFPVWLIFFYIEGLYSLRTSRLQSLPISLLRALTFSLITSFVFFYLFPKAGLTPRRNLFLIVSFAYPLTFLWHQLFLFLSSKDTFTQKVVLLGDEKAIHIIKEELISKPFLGYQIIGSSPDINELPLEESDIIVIDRQRMQDHKTSFVLLELIKKNKFIMEMSLFSEMISGKIPITSIDHTWFLQVCGNPTSLLDRLLKSFIDRAIAVMLLIPTIVIYVFLLPLLGLVQGRPLFYTQPRTGLFGEIFKIYKLRTMVVNAEKKGDLWTTTNDTRITPLGSLLRKTRLDELPQLWNILKGDMSLVGPRPERPEIIEEKLVHQIPFYNQRHLVKPGVTGWAQVNFRYGASEEDALEKLQYDLFYVKNQSFWLDVRILMKTVKTVITGAGR